MFERNPGDPAQCNHWQRRPWGHCWCQNTDPMTVANGQIDFLSSSALFNVQQTFKVDWHSKSSENYHRLYLDFFFFIISSDLALRTNSLNVFHFPQEHWSMVLDVDFYISFLCRYILCLHGWNAALTVNVWHDDHENTRNEHLNLCLH